MSFKDKIREELYGDIASSDDNHYFVVQHGYFNLSKMRHVQNPSEYTDRHQITKLLLNVAMYGHVKFFKYIPMDDTGHLISYIQAAIEHRHYNVVKFFMPYADPGEYSVHPQDWVDESAKYGMLNLVKLFRNLSPDASLDNGLVNAIKWKWSKIAKYLIDEGANVNPTENDEDDLDPVYEAILVGNLQILKYLLSRGANLALANYDSMGTMLDAVNSKSIPLVKYLIDQGMGLDNDLLYDAVKNYDLDMVKFLMSCGLTMDKPYTFYHYRLTSSPGAIETLEYVLQMLPNASFKFKDTDLTFAILLGRIPIIEYILKKSICIDYNSLQKLGITNPVILTMLNQKLVQQYALFENVIRTEQIDLIRYFIDKHIYIDFEWLKRIPITNTKIISMLNESLRIQHLTNTIQNLGIQ
jgi:ankyrin repeat protein